MHAPLCLHTRAQGGRGVLELLVVDQARHQDVARLLGRELLELLVELELAAVLGGDEARRLDLQQGGCHHDEVAGDVEVELLHALDLCQVLVCDLRDADGADVHLLLAHQLQQQVEGALVGLELHAV